MLRMCNKLEKSAAHRNMRDWILPIFDKYSLRKQSCAQRCQGNYVNMSYTALLHVGVSNDYKIDCN